ncbi:Calx-beta domain-containing protein [Muriicola marianensis]|uniref:Calx-beta domain-containing protein n=1 Tax=Muriicola marianensis TaxID=1324801 RepID=A0ABQ1QTD3_9FLAO|nr:Calx-beta domain-containing protein [Muriicola marianensis]GGD43943.1 hypothetical protein GCM10011361_08630 [Muriicola marianensis]
MKHNQAVAVLIFVLFCTVTPVLYGQDTFRDNFESVSYSNNDGTMNFATDWVESGDDDDPSNGRIFVRTGPNRLRIENMDSAELTRSLNLSGATGVVLTMDYWEISGNEQIDVDLWNGTGWNTVATLNGSGSVNYTLAANEMSANSQIRFITNSGAWGSTEAYEIDNIQFNGNVPAGISINDITVNEDDGTATFTVTLNKAFAGGFTVDWATADGSAVAGSDYTTSSGTLTFAGTAGETETLVVTLIDDAVPEFNDENFLVNLSNISNPGVIIADGQGSATIIDDEYAFNAPLVLTHEFDGYMDYTSTAGTLRTQPNTGNTCAITTSSSNTFSTPIPATATIEQAILYWAHSGATPDTQVTFDGNTVNADFLYGTSLTNRTFYGGRADVTAIVTAVPNPSTYTWTFSGLTIDNTDPYCNTATTLGGWSLMVFYTDNSLPASTINVYEGFSGESNSSSSYTLSGFFAIGATGSKTTVQSWEGDQTLSNNESLTVTTGLGTFNLVGDGDNTGTPTINPFNSTHYDNTATPTLNNTNSHGVDLDTYNISPFISPGETSVTTNVGSGQDFVILNTVTLKVPSNLTTGIVFEDVNYGGGAGRNRATAGGVPIPNATVELYDGGGSLVTTTTTNAAGRYVFAGMANGSYTVRVVNNSVRSTRPGGSTCTTCIPVQTFKTDYIASVVVEDPNSVGGEDPSGQDPGPGTLNNAQSISSFTILNEGIAGMDFGFNFNTIVNTNEDGQGSLEQFIINSNATGEAGLDIVANGIFDPAAGEDTSIFMIPPTGDALGRAADANFTAGIFDIDVDFLTAITGDNTHIDGRTQTAYSGDTNSGSIGAGGSAVGTSAINLPNYDLPEIQVHAKDGNTFINEGNANVIRNLSIYADDLAGVQVNNGSVTVSSSLIGVDALGANNGAILFGIEVTGGEATVDSNYLSTNEETGILINGGTATTVQNNHLTGNGNDKCFDNITITGGTGILIQQNLLELSAAMGIDGNGIAGGVTITENTITSAGQDGGNCNGVIENAGIRLEGSNSSITNNIIYQNGGAGIVLGGGTTSGNLISQNSIYANGTTADALGIDLDLADTMGDGVTLNDNGDTDVGPNGAANFPIISAAYMEGSNVVIKGWSRPGATLEFFLTDINEGSAATGDNQLGYTKDYGEGQIYLGTAVEGSVDDSDAGVSSYTDTDGNTDNTNLFEVRIPAPPSIGIGNFLTGTATLANTTSEFSPFSEIAVRTVITNRRITYRVNPD